MLRLAAPICLKPYVIQRLNPLYNLLATLLSHLCVVTVNNRKRPEWCTYWHCGLHQYHVDGRPHKYNLQGQFQSVWLPNTWVLGQVWCEIGRASCRERV